MYWKIKTPRNSIYSSLFSLLAYENLSMQFGHFGTSFIIEMPLVSKEIFHRVLRRYFWYMKPCILSCFTLIWSPWDWLCWRWISKHWKPNISIHVCTNWHCIFRSHSLTKYFSWKKVTHISLNSKELVYYVLLIFSDTLHDWPIFGISCWFLQVDIAEISTLSTF